MNSAALKLMDAALPLPAVGEGVPDWTVKRITSGVRSGEEEAIRELHARYAPQLLRYAAVVCRGDLCRAGDCVQAVWLRVIRHLKVTEDEAALWAWLAKAARCAAVDIVQGEMRYGGMLARLRSMAPKPLDTKSGLPVRVY